MGKAYAPGLTAKTRGWLPPEVVPVVISEKKYEIQVDELYRISLRRLTRLSRAESSRSNIASSLFQPQNGAGRCPHSYS